MMDVDPALPLQGYVGSWEVRPGGLHRQISTSRTRSPAPATFDRPSRQMLTGSGPVYVGVLEPVPADRAAETTPYLGAFNGKIEAPGCSTAFRATT